MEDDIGAIWRKGGRGNNARSFGLGWIDGKASISCHRVQGLLHVQPADIGWPTGNGKKLSNSQACCLDQLCLDAA